MWVLWINKVRRCCSVIILAAVILTDIQISQAAKILLAPTMYTWSHVSQFIEIGEALVAQHHEVYSVLSDSYPHVDLVSKGGIKVIQYHAAEPDRYTFDEAKIAEMMAKTAITDISIKQLFRTRTDGFIQFCTTPLADQDLYDKLKSMQFDLSIVDTLPHSRCLLVLMYRLDIPYVGVTTIYEPWLSRNPALPSFVPATITNSPFTERMSFWERITNLWETVEWIASPRVPLIDDNLIIKYAPDKPAVTMNHLAGKCLLYLIINSFILDYPRPVLPNEIYLGGLTHKPAKPLPKDLEEFVKSATDGIIVVSFGSESKVLPNSVVPKLLAAFKQLKQRVVWRSPESAPQDIPSNVRLLKWLPQNDLLGHAQTRLFITHSGANGQFEGLYHGVPMIALPLFGDQHYNAPRTPYHGFGIQMDINDFTPEELVTNIEKVINDKSYKNNIMKASAIYRSEPMTSLEKAIYWIEHVMKYGGDHLRSHALDMPWYEYLMLDILVFIVVVGLASLVLIWCTCRCLLRATAQPKTGSSASTKWKSS